MVWSYVKKGFLLVVADMLSIITIVLCLIQKLPQIRDLYGYKSARGKFIMYCAVQVLCSGMQHLNQFI